MSPETSPLFGNIGRDGRLEQARRRLDQAATLLEQRIARHVAQAAARAASLIDADRARLATELDAARGRERDLAAAGAEASAALGEAIAALKRRLGAVGED